MDKLSALRTFNRVAETASFSKAASLLGLSRPAVSKHIGDLEAELGVQLFIRTTRQVQLTDAGELYLERSRELLAEFDALDAEIRASESSLRGVLRVAGPQTFSELHLVPAFDRFLREHDSLRIEMTLTDRFVDLVDERIDVGIRIAELEDSTLVARRLSTMRVLALASPRYLNARGAPRTPADLARHDLVIDSNFRNPTSWRFRRRGRGSNVRVAGRLTVNSALMARDLVIGGAGISLIPEFVVEDALARGQLQTVLDEYLDYEIGIYAVYPSRRHLPNRVRVFVDYLVEYFAERDRNRGGKRDARVRKQRQQALDSPGKAGYSTRP